MWSLLSVLFLLVGSQPALANPDYLYREMNMGVTGEKMVDLRQVLGIDARYQGRQIEFVVVRVKAYSERGAATLFSNNQKDGATQGFTGVSRDLFFRPSVSLDEIDREVQTLKTYFRGNVLVEALGVKFFSNTPPRPPYPSPNPRPIGETAFVDINYVGDAILDVNRYINVARYMGYRLRAAILRGSSGAFPPVPGEVAFCTATECSRYVPLSRMDSTATFYTRGEYADRFSDWNFYLRGSVYVESITLQFVR